MFGNSSYGQCGLLKEQLVVRTPNLIATNVNKIICLPYTSYYVNDKLDMYISGLIYRYQITSQYGFVFIYQDDRCFY